MKLNFNGSEYTLTDNIGRACGWTKDKAKSEAVLEKVAEYEVWDKIPFKLQKALIMSGFNPPR